MVKQQAPPLDQQLNDIMTYCVKLSKDNQDMERLPIGPPKCETLKTSTRGHIAHNKEGVPIGLSNNDVWDHPIPNSRKCPSCFCAAWNSLTLGTVTTCKFCHQDYVW